MTEAWGLEVILDLYNCQPELVRSKNHIKEFPQNLCKIIEMIPYGQTIIKRFGQDDLQGYSAFQFIQTSSISIHADEAKNRIFLNVFSCKKFDSLKVMEYAKIYFKSNLVSTKIIKRGENKEEGEK